eukprot:CFRG2618T1
MYNIVMIFLVQLAPRLLVTSLISSKSIAYLHLVHRKEYELPQIESFVRQPVQANILGLPNRKTHKQTTHR